LLALGQWEDAADAFLKAAEATGNPGEAFYGLAKVLQKSGQLAPARAFACRVAAFENSTPAMQELAESSSSSN
jgi:hypothetical protein